MVSFYVYDIGFLIIFTVFIIWFLYTRKHNLKREGILYLYRTQWGIKIINKIGEKHKKLFVVLDWLSIISGYILMIVGIWFVWKLVDLYIIQVIITGTTPLKVFPLLPVIPYTPELFKLSFLPPFYFTYWIVSLAIIAIGHEFAHGIYAKAKGVKIKSTGFGFLGPFIAAFVEPDEKKLQKIEKKKQIAVLSAGTFANIVMTFIFFILFILFFYAAFTPSGYVFNAYSYSILPVSEISLVGNYSNSLGNFSEIRFNNQTYYFKGNLTNQTQIIAFDNAPAFKSGLQGVIIAIDNKKIRNQKDLAVFLAKTKPGENITITVLANQTQEYNLMLGENPRNSSIGYIGVSSLQTSQKGFFSKIISWFVSFMEPSTYYSPRIDGTLVIFIKDLFFWIIMLNLSVAIINMVPLGIFDGGRVFYLTMLSIFKSEKIAKNIFKTITYIILFAVILLCVLWFFAV